MIAFDYMKPDLFVHIQRNLKLKIRPSTKMPHAINVESFDVRVFGATNCHVGHVQCTYAINLSDGECFWQKMHFIRSLSHTLVTLFRDVAVAFFTLSLFGSVCMCVCVYGVLVV